MAINNKSGVNLFKVLYGMSFTEIPVMVFSDPGMGKSSIMRSLANIKGVNLYMKSANKLTDVEVMGIPYTQDTATGKELRYSTPEYIKELNSDNGILFFDELTTAPTSIQKMLLTIIQDCEFNEFKIPKSTFRVAAGNYSNIVGTEQMSMALMNRFANFHWDFDLKDFSDGFTSGWNNYEIPIINPKEVREGKELNYKNTVIEFLRSHPTEGYRMPEEIIDRTDVSFPTPRSWDNLTIALSILDGNEPEFIQCVIDSLVGPSTGSLFYKYMKKNNVVRIDITQYVGNEGNFVLPDPDKHDQVSYIMKSLMFYMNKDAMKYKKLWIRVNNLLHNKDKKYGDYVQYDTLVMQYINAGVNKLLKTCQTIEEKSVLVKELYANIDDWNDLQSVSLMK